MAEPKQYVPKANVRARETQYGEFLSVGFDVKELIAFAEKNKNDRGYLNLTISRRKEPNENATHSIYLDTYKPGQGGGQRSAAPKPSPVQDPEFDQMPPF